MRLETIEHVNRTKIQTLGDVLSERTDMKIELYQTSRKSGHSLVPAQVALINACRITISDKTTLSRTK